MPINGTPAALADRASSTVSPTYISLRPGFMRRMECSPSGAGFPFATSSAQMIGSKRKSAAKRLSEISAS